MLGLNVNKVFGIIPTLLLVNYWYFVVRISMSMVGTVYRTLDMRLWQELALHPWIQFSIVGWGLSLQNKGNFLYSAATTNSTMDSSTKTMEDGVVDSPPNRNAQPGRVSSPLPLKAKSTTQTRCPGSFGDSRSSRKLYNIPSFSSPSGVVKVFLRTSINFLYLSCYLFSWTCIEI
jgi:hypothetical protein